jgi:ABC-type amino acid transport substrate-binding protein
MNLENNNKSKKLRVGLFEENMPYASCKPTYQGVAVDIWKETAIKYNLDYEFVCFKEVNFDRAIEKLKNDEIDIFLAEVSVIERRYDWALYSRPFFVSELYIYRKDKQNSFFSFLFDVQIKYILAIVFFFIFIYANIYIFIFNFTVIDAFYKTLLSFLTIGGEIIGQKTRILSKLSIKLLNTIWSMFVFFFRSFIISRIIASVISNKSVISDEEFKQISQVNVISNSAYVDMMKSIGKFPVENASSTDIAKKIEKSNGDEYWFDDSNIIDSNLKKAGVVAKLVTTERPALNDEFTIAVNKKRPDILDIINKSLVEMQGNGMMHKICKGYIDNPDRCLL